MKLILMTNSGSECRKYALSGCVERKWKRPFGFRCLCLSLSLLFLAGCQKSATESVAIAPEDMCRYCKMAISEKRYAAEFIDRDGGAFKFDDIGCMLNFIKGQQNKNQIAAYFLAQLQSLPNVREVRSKGLMNGNGSRLRMPTLYVHPNSRHRWMGALQLSRTRRKQK